MRESKVRGVLLAVVLLLSAADLSAQAAPDERHCFSIHVRLNGKTVEGPEAVTFKAKEKEITVSREGKCFTVPSALLKEEQLDIGFMLPEDKIYLTSVATGFFAGPWDVFLEDKKFDKDLGFAPPKHKRTKETCIVKFHVGEPESQVMATPCRSPRLPKKSDGHRYE